MSTTEDTKPRTVTEWTRHLTDQIGEMLLMLDEDDARHVLQIHRERVDDIVRALRS
jgi:hypothetical protein